MDIKNFVTFEQALTLKKLGFKEKCLYYYFNNTLHPNDVYAHRIDRSSFHRKYNVESLGKVHNVAKEPLVCDAPTLDEAQRWLIDKKGLCICPGPEAEYVPNSEKLNDSRFVYTGWTYNILIITEEGDLCPGPWCPKGIVFSSYNEALSDGINACFKLLKGEDDLRQYGISVGENKFHLNHILRK